MTEVNSLPSGLILMKGREMLTVGIEMYVSVQSLLSHKCSINEPKTCQKRHFHTNYQGAENGCDTYNSGN